MLAYIPAPWILWVFQPFHPPLARSEGVGPWISNPNETGCQAEFCALLSSMARFGGFLGGKIILLILLHVRQTDKMIQNAMYIV